MYNGGRNEVMLCQVLIVEDERNLADALRQILEEEKFQTTIAYDGEEGLSYAMSDLFDMIISRCHAAKEKWI